MSSFYSERPRYDDADFLSIGSGEQVTGIDFSLSVGASITGTVFDTDTGVPLSGVEVQRDLDEGGSHGSTSTGSDGRYTLSGLSPGRYRVWANATDRGYIEQYNDGKLFWDFADLVTIAGKGEEQPGIDFGLKRGGAITGRVFDGSTGAPIPGMDVRAELNGFGFFWTSTDGDGSYTLFGVPDGLIEVIVSGQGYLEQRKTVTMSGAGEVRLDF